MGHRAPARVESVRALVSNAPEGMNDDGVGCAVPSTAAGAEGCAASELASSGTPSIDPPVRRGVD